MHFNHLAILVCALSAFLLGGPWYSKALFGRAWGRANGVPIDGKREGAKHPARVFGISFIAAWAAAYAFAILVGPEQLSLHHWLHHGLVCGLGIAATSFAINYQFANRSMVLLAIDGGYHIVQFVLYGLILGLWH